ncbi:MULTISPECIES: hypothetical protein [unclassified Actinomadura]|uniref:hypothetical protein n=1 Tax=unclassified Actinomadura TaxID=2626254 RepID=UPI0011ECD40B|nr:hypothetical protein [Actinomadura sp. K4S16]
MKHFELLVGAGLIVLSLFSSANCLLRVRRGTGLEGMQYVVVANFFMGVFLITFALARSDAVGGVVMLGSACLGFGAGALVLINSVRQIRKDPFD